MLIGACVNTEFDLYALGINNNAVNMIWNGNPHAHDAHTSVTGNTERLLVSF